MIPNPSSTPHRHHHIHIGRRMCSHHIHIDDYSTLPSITHETYLSIALKIITPTITTITHETYLSIALKIITSTPTQNDHTCTQRDHPSGVLNQYHQHYHRGCPPAQTTTTTPYIICSGPPYYIQHTRPVTTNTISTGSVTYGLQPDTTMIPNPSATPHRHHHIHISRRMCSHHIHIDDYSTLPPASHMKRISRSH